MDPTSAAFGKVQIYITTIMGSITWGCLDLKNVQKLQLIQNMTRKMMPDFPPKYMKSVTPILFAFIFVFKASFKCWC